MILVIGTGTCQEHTVSLEQPMVHDLWSLTKATPYICLFFVGFGNQKAVASHSLSMRMVYLLWSWELTYCDLILCPGNLIKHARIDAGSEDEDMSLISESYFLSGNKNVQICTSCAGSSESTKTPWSYQNCQFITIRNQSIFITCPSCFTNIILWSRTGAESPPLLVHLMIRCWPLAERTAGFQLVNGSREKFINWYFRDST